MLGTSRKELLELFPLRLDKPLEASPSETVLASRVDCLIRQYYLILVLTCFNSSGIISLHNILTEFASGYDYEILKSLLQPDLSNQLHEADLTLEQLTALAANNRNAEIVRYCISLGANVK